MDFTPMKKGALGMKHLIHFLFVTAVLAAGTSVLTACGSDNQSGPDRTVASMPAESILAEEYAQTEAIIKSIDSKTRVVTLVGQNNQAINIQAPADVDLSKLKPGDVVILGAYHKVSVQALPAGSAPLGTRQQAMKGRSAAGETPGRAAGVMTSTVTEIAEIDTVNNKITLKTADGRSRTLDVKNPDNQRKLKELEVGDLVQIDVFEAVTASLKPKN